MRVHILGSGDAFGTGGRHHSCLHVTAPGVSLIVDCGATAPLAMARAGVSAGSIDACMFTHYHGDHFGGLPYVLLEAQFVARRTKPLVIAGPPGIERRTMALMEATYPGMWSMLSFPVHFQDVAPDTAGNVAGVDVVAIPVVHDDRVGPCLGYRMTSGGRTFAFSGDTGWTERVLDLARGAHVFLVECYTWDVPLPMHIDWSTLERRLPDIEAGRVILTHMGPQMLAHAETALPVERAADGLVVEP